MTALPGVVWGAVLFIVAVTGVAFIAKATGKRNRESHDRAVAVAEEKAAAPVPTDLELMHGWMNDLAKKVNRDAEAQRVKLQWFLFWLPAIYAVTYGLLYGIIIAVTH